ncbi:hypothetical protein [Pseudomonas sp. R5-89-07]|uniref:hypothetical protein n=1 Tax=Pseudomonas sp. R5-89-07 TaxID=658644 RepID=UPI000F71F25C|nr:hypothetical protein [Pseudomonas sp. R5-89-07]AZF04713.1 hypothetical protein C4J94_1944 [Pseudomonas sp. R5-89-07]
MTNGINTSGSGLPPLHNWSAGGSQAPATGSGGFTRLSVVDKAIGTQQPLGTTSSYVSKNLMVNGASRHFDGQGLYGGMSKVGNPYISSDDHLLATDLSNNFSMLDKFKKDGHLTQSGLQQIANEDVHTSNVSERTILLAREILNRPRLNEAILVDGGKITPESLAKASDLIVGNTNPNTQSADPFHSKTNAQVVQAFRGMFDQLRDTSEDYNFFFEKHRYVKTDTLIEMSKDPDETDKNGNVVRDPATGFPKKKYSEQQVYVAKNIVERPGLLDSLDSNKANGTNIFGSHNIDGWLKNYSIDRWLENDKKEKGD